MQMTSLLYNHFDSIVCITMKINKRRQVLARTTASQLGIPFKFYYVDRHPSNNGMIGCFTSHINVISHMYDANVEYGL